MGPANPCESRGGMEVLDALLVEGTRVLFSSAPAALFFWFNLAFLVVLATVLLPGRLRKARRRRQVERLFEASARASRGERHDNELAAFAPAATTSSTAGRLRL